MVVVVVVVTTVVWVVGAKENWPTDEKGAMRGSRRARGCGCVIDAELDDIDVDGDISFCCW